MLKCFLGILIARNIRSRIGPLKDNVGNLVTDDQSIVNMLNKYFSSVFNTTSGGDNIDTNVTSDVPQGSVLGPVLFVIYINDIDLELNSLIAKFADDTKIGNSVISDCDGQSLQKDLRKISAWSDRWDMPFNVNKCRILQMGTRNIKNMNTKWVG